MKQTARRWRQRVTRIFYLASLIAGGMFCGASAFAQFP
ncbi:hypothetical protein QFZ99_000048 [Paraburkholderia atlantica]